LPIHHPSMVGEYNIVQRPIDAVYDGNFAPVPLIIGGTKDETSLFAQFADLPTGVLGLITGTNRTIEMPPDKYIEAVNLLFKDSAELVLEEYPPLPDSNWDYAVKLIDDYLWHCPNRLIARAARNIGAPEVWTYQFNYPMDTIPYFNQDLAKCRGTHACHGLDLPYTWNCYQIGPIPIPFSPDEVEFIRILNTYWTEFASGRVNTNPSVPFWPPFNNTADPLLFLDAPPRGVTQDNYRSDRCLFWDTLRYVF